MGAVSRTVCPVLWWKPSIAPSLSHCDAPAAPVRLRLPPGARPCLQALELDEHYDNTDDMYCDIADRLEAVEAAAPAASLAGHLGALNLKKDGKLKSGGGKVGSRRRWGLQAHDNSVACCSHRGTCRQQPPCAGVLPGPDAARPRASIPCSMCDGL